MVQRNKHACYQRLVYITIIFLVQLLFSKAWEVPGCGRTKRFTPGARIMGGSAIDIHEAPWQVFIAGNESNQLYFCGGSIIQPQWILTAAHCLPTPDLYSVDIYAGLSNLKQILHDDSSIQRRKATRVIVHMDFIYDPETSVMDIALVELEKKLYFNENVSAICQPKGKSKETLPSTAIVTGWGETSPGVNFIDVQSLFKKRLQMVKLPLYNSSECERFFFQEVNTIICAGPRIVDLDNRKGTCYGDSGGPLVVKMMRKGVDVWVQVGITSMSYLEGCGYIPTVFMRVARFRRWIECAIAPHCNKKNHYVLDVLTYENITKNSAMELKVLSETMIARHLVIIAINLVAFVF